MIYGGLLHCEKQGIAVPGRLAIAGFGGMTVGQAMKCPLTTINFPRYDVGRRAARTILNAMVGQEVNMVSDLGFELIEGGTS